MNYVIIFFVAVFSLVIAGSEAEQADDWETYFEREMEKQDSLWELIRYEGNLGIDYGDSIMVKTK